MDVAAHFQSDEIQGLNRLQGGADLEKYGAPYYGKLWDIIESHPEIISKTKEAVKELFGLQPQKAREVTSSLKKVLDEKFKPLSSEPVTEPQNERALELASEGEDGDTEIAFMPQPMLQFFWDLYPEEIPVEERINENTGLPEFWNFFEDFLLPVVGGVVGTVIAPGIGTAIGAGLGSIGGSVIHNMSAPEDEQRSFLSMLGNGLLSGGLGYAGGAAVDAFKSGKGLMDSTGAALGALSDPWVGGATALGGLMGSFGGGSSSNAQKGGNSLDDYNQEMKEARARDRERIELNYLEAAKHREAENKRLMEHEKALEAQRLENIKKEQEYQRRRMQAIEDYNARYHPNFSPEFLRNLIQTQGV